MVSASDILNAGILIVDDQEDNVALLELMLRGAGYTSLASTMDPRQVCDLHRANRYSLTLDSPEAVTSIEIDPELAFPDIDRSNNKWTRH